MTQNKANESTVTAYSRHGSSAYEDPMNKNFLYGEITTQFLDQIEFPDKVKSVLDIGCGIGTAVKIASIICHNGRIYGIDPIQTMINIAKKDQPLNIEFSVGSAENIPLHSEIVSRHTNRPASTSPGLK